MSQQACPGISLPGEAGCCWAAAPQEAGGPSRAALNTGDASMALPFWMSFESVFRAEHVSSWHLFMGTDAVTARLGEAGWDPEPTVA